jgi:hypothetical protein
LEPQFAAVNDDAQTVGEAKGAFGELRQVALMWSHALFTTVPHLPPPVTPAYWHHAELLDDTAI